MSGRIRTIKPEWLEDELLASAPDHVRMLSVGLILMADDHGRGRASVNFVAGDVWRYDRSPEVLTKVREGLNWLSKIRFIRLYEADGQSYFEIRNWQKHQKVQHVGKERVPAPTDNASPEDSSGCAGQDSPRESLTKVPESLTPDLRPHTSDLIPPTMTTGESAPAAAPIPKAIEVTPKPKPGRATRCPSSVDPEADAFCERWKIPSPSTNPEAANMLDHFASAPGKDGLKTLWDATWRKWERRASGNSSRAKGSTRADQLPLGASTSSPDVDAVWGAYVAAVAKHKPGAVPTLTGERRVLIAARLREHSVATLSAACEGLWLSAWHVDKGLVTIESALKDAELIDRHSAAVLQRQRDREHEQRLEDERAMAREMRKVQAEAAPVMSAEQSARAAREAMASLGGR